MCNQDLLLAVNLIAVNMHIVIIRTDGNDQHLRVACVKLGKLDWGRIMRFVTENGAPVLEYFENHCAEHLFVI